MRTRFLSIAIAAGALIALAGCGSDEDPMQDVKDQAAKLTAENTAKRIQADYDKRGVPGKVTCVDFDVDEQRCEVRQAGKVVMLLDVRLNVSTGVLDVRPAASDTVMP